MKAYLSISFLVLFALYGCTDNKSNKASTDAIHVDATASGEEMDSTGGAAITFAKTEHDFGNITQGEKAVFSFKFTNTGKGQLLISAVNPSCGCTVAEYTKEPVNPGESGFIKVTFDSELRVDRFEKSITVITNTVPTEHTLYVKGMVIPKPEDQYKILHGG